MVRILLVDDSKLIRIRLKAILEEQDEWVVVSEAADGEHALQEWNRSRFNLTVMDFRMPRMNGLEAGRELSRQHPESPVLMITVDPSRQLAHEAKKVGIKGLCAKADVRSIFSAVEALLKGSTYFESAAA